MQRLFTMFPRGLPGVALLLLRVSVAVTLMVVVLRQVNVLPWALVAAYCLAGFAVLIGVFTPLASVLAVCAAAWGAIYQQEYDQSIIELVFTAVALCLIGPGAYSIDALRFGQREVHWPSKNPPEE